MRSLREDLLPLKITPRRKIQLQLALVNVWNLTMYYKDNHMKEYLVHKLKKLNPWVDYYSNIDSRSARLTLLLHVLKVLFPTPSGSELSQSEVKWFVPHVLLSPGKQSMASRNTWRFARRSEPESLLCYNFDCSAISYCFPKNPACQSVGSLYSNCSDLRAEEIIRQHLFGLFQPLFSCNISHL